MNEQTRDPTRAVVPFNDQLHEQEAEWAKVLPAHVSRERFTKVIITAINQNPALWKKATPRSFWSACSKAATDGLYPDGREAAFVLFGNAVQYMPMIAGIRKLVRNSKEIATWEATLVYENEVKAGLFKLVAGDEPRIYHEPIITGERGRIVAGYSVARLKSGEISREYMTIEQMDRVKEVSRSKGSGPWTQWPEEMYRKTILRRHSKALPMSTDLEEVFAHDDAANFSTVEPTALEERIASPQDINGRLDKLAGPTNGEQFNDDITDLDLDVIDPDTGEIVSHETNAPPAIPHPVETGSGAEAASPSSSQTEEEPAPEPLTVAEVKSLKNLHGEVSSLMGEKRIAAMVELYRERNKPSGHHARVVDLLERIHRERAAGQSSPADCDNALRNAIIFAGGTS